MTYVLKVAVYIKNDCMYVSGDRERKAEGDRELFSM